MPGEEIDRPNPQPLPSHIDDHVLQLAVKLDKTELDKATYTGLQEFRRAANYIAAGEPLTLRTIVLYNANNRLLAMIFLKDNVLLERDLQFDDIKPRLLGHWGTCPGLTLVYSHLNLMATQRKQDIIFVVGPGHGAPAILSSLWLEGSLGKFYPEYARDKEGLHKLITRFSTPSGFPSHINAETPGAIHEGGELGYALSVAFGAVMDKPDLIVACVVGDGESETGPTAAAWHGAKYIDPRESGAVLPIVHVNGFKISERTIYGCMDDKEMVALFTGYGYQCRFVEDLADIDADMCRSMEWALDEIHKIQKAARSGKPIMKPRWPVLIMRTPKGWGAPKKVRGQFVEGSFRAHQVPLMAAKSDPSELKQLQQWLGSYKPNELFTKDGGVGKAILDIIPADESKRIGQQIDTYGSHEVLSIPDWKKYGVKKGGQASCMQTIGDLLDQVLVDNPKSMRIFSPDELVSNKLDAVFNHTGRNFQWDEFSNARGGRVIEILSEHTCQGMLQGYTLTGRTGLFPSYESFLGIVHTMMVQYSKFNKIVRCFTKVHSNILTGFTGSGDQLEKGHKQHQLPRNKHLDTSRTQWILAPEPFLHWRRPQPQTHSGTCLPTPRRQHLPLDPRPLPSLKKLRELNGWLEAASTSLPLPRRSRQPLPGRRLGMEIRQHGRRSEPRRRHHRHRRRTHLRSHRSGRHAAQTYPEPPRARRQRHRPLHPQARRRTPARSLAPGLRRPLHARLCHSLQLPRLRGRDQGIAVRQAQSESRERRGV